MMLSIILPVFKSEASIEPIYQRLTQALERIAGEESTRLFEHEIIFVDDSSPDASWSLIQRLAKKDGRVRGLKLSRNFGQHYAITAGLELCRGDWAAIMDCDLQDRPEDLHLLWSKALEGFDVVNARRALRQDSLWKRTCSRAFHVVFEFLSGLAYDPDVANYRLISRRVVTTLGSMREGSRVVGAQVHWLGFPTAYVDVSHDSRKHGKSSYTFRKLFALALDTAISYSNKPLRLSIALGAVIFFGALIVLVWIMFRALFWGIPVAGWASVMTTLFVLGGIILANIGVQGIYLGKIYDEVRRRPIYIVTERLNC